MEHKFKVGDKVRVSNSAKSMYVSTKFGVVGTITEACIGYYTSYKVSVPFVSNGKVISNIQYFIREEHLKYAKQANKKAGRNVAVK